MLGIVHIVVFVCMVNVVLFALFSRFVVFVFVRFGVLFVGYLYWCWLLIYLFDLDLWMLVIGFAAGFSRFWLVWYYVLFVAVGVDFWWFVTDIVVICWRFVFALVVLSWASFVLFGLLFASIDSGGIWYLGWFDLSVVCGLVDGCSLVLSFVLLVHDSGCSGWLTSWIMWCVVVVSCFACWL